MEEARTLLRRLERIDVLERRLLAEVERAVADGERWVEAEGPGTEAAAAALARCRALLQRTSARRSAGTSSSSHIP